MNIGMRKKILKGFCLLLNVILTDRFMFVTMVIGAVILEDIIDFGNILIEYLLISILVILVKILVEECLSNLQMTLYDKIEDDTF